MPVPFTKDGLTDRQRLFVESYAATRNATKAARVAGYRGDAHGLGVIGSRLLRNPRVRTGLEKLGVEIPDYATMQDEPPPAAVPSSGSDRSPAVPPPTSVPSATRLRPRQARALAELLRGATHAAAADAAGCSERTIRRWVESEDFAAALEEARLESLERARRAVEGRTARAIEVIDAGLDGKAGRVETTLALGLLDRAGVGKGPVIDVPALRRRVFKEAVQAAYRYLRGRVSPRAMGEFRAAFASFDVDAARAKVPDHMRAEAVADVLDTLRAELAPEAYTDVLETLARRYGTAENDDADEVAE